MKVQADCGHDLCTAELRERTAEGFFANALRRQYDVVDVIVTAPFVFTMYRNRTAVRHQLGPEAMAALERFRVTGETGDLVAEMRLVPPTVPLGKER